MPRAFDRREFLTSSAAGAATFLMGRPSFGQPTDPTNLSIAEAQRLIRTGALSPLELVEAYAYHADLLAEKRDLYDPSTLERIERGAQVAASDYADALYQLTLVRKAIAAVFENVDVLVTPTLVQLPVSIEAAQLSPGEITGILVRNTAPFNTYGIPAITVPCGFSREGLPIGLQLCGRALGEVDVLALAHAYEQATPWHDRTPPM